MGIVYRAKDTVLDREVALKTIRTGSDVEPELRERFYREARACARLQHPNIIIVHDLGEVDQVAYIAMELLEGMDLRKVVAQKEDIPVVLKIEAMAQICEALGYAHARGIIHRDVKPSNLFLTGLERAKVLDFGIARLPSSHLTVAGKILGTPNYMAPEQILAKPSDARSDLFSAAVVFFELLTYTHPFKSQLIPRRIVESEPDSLFDYDSKLPLPLESIFARALAKDPALRYQRGEDFSADLRAVADALRQNASPSFSGIQLLSAREIAPPHVSFHPEQADLSLLKPTPPGEDPYEWRFSEVLRLIPAFEEALEANDWGLAGKIVAQLEAIEAVDNRFVDAVDLCRKRMQDQSPSPAPPNAPAEAVKYRAATTDSGATKYCINCGAPNRIMAQFCIGCGASFKNQVVESPRQQPQQDPPNPPPLSPLRTASKVTGVQSGSSLTGSRVSWGGIDETSLFANSDLAAATPVREPVYPVAFPPPASRTPLGKTFKEWTDYSAWTPRQKQIVIGVAGAIVVIILLCLLLVFLSPESVRPAVAFAFIHPLKAVLYDHPGGSGIVTLTRGDRLQVLRLPLSRDQEWVEVQFVSPKKTFRPGYVRATNLDEWDSVNADAALALIRMFGPAASALEAELDFQIGLLRKWIGRFPQNPRVPGVRIETARLETDLIRRQRAAGLPQASWMGRIEAVREQLDAAGSSPEIAAAKDELQQEMLTLPSSLDPSPPKVPPTVAPHTPSLRDNIGQLLDHARALWVENKYQEAKIEVERVLHYQPKNSDAIELQKNIKSILDAESSTIHC